MKVYGIEDILKRVRIALDQNTQSQALADIGDVDTLSLNDIIRSKVVEAVKRVHSEAPVYLLDGGNNFGDAIYWMDEGSGWVLLPDDFMRFVVFEMDDWVRPVYFANSIDDAQYSKMQSRYKGIRGTYQRPECFITFRPEGRALEFYSSKDDTAKVRRAVYTPYPVIDSYGGIGIYERCFDSVVYTIAALTMSAYGDQEKSNVLLELAKTSLL